MEGEAMTILSAIENLEHWLLKNKDSSWFVVEEADLRNSVVWLLEIWEENKEKLYRLLDIIMADPFDTEKLQGENADLWEDDEGFNKLINKEKLQSLFRDMAEYAICPCQIESDDEMDLMTDNGQGSKERLYSYVADVKGNLDSFIYGVARQLHRGDKQKMLWKEVEEAKNELRVMVDLLKSEGLHYFISDVAEMAHYAQLLIRLMDSDASTLYLHMFFNYAIYCEGVLPTWEKLLTELSDKFKSIKKSLQETKERMQEFGVERAESSQINVRAELVAPTYPDVVIGLEKEIKFVLRLIDDAFYYRYIGITGMSGIGKTTLARILYNHPTIVDRYECRAWVCLSSWKLSRKELLIKLIRKVVDNSKGFQKNDDYMLLENMDNRSLRQMLHQQLKDKQHFIVLDDLSEDTYLDYVLKALSKAAPRNKFLFTTRNMNLLHGCMYIHTVKLLDGDDSWQLLLKTIMVGSSDFPRQLEKKGRETLMRKCGGLPLAIKELGMHWAKMRRSGNEWEYILQSSINLDLSATSKALELTYLSLDPDEKSCFLRLAFFKEDATIRRNKFLQICTAEGLKEEQCDIGLDKLARQSIIEFRRKKNFHLNVICERLSIKKKNFHLNVICERLSIEKAKDEIGFEILMKDGNHRASHEPRHRVVYCSREKFDYHSSQDERHLISLFFHGGSHFDWTIHHFEQLKVLDMEDFGLKILPETVGELSELRYLGLRNNYIKELPHSLGRLKRLEVLDIALNFMVQVSNIIWEMDSLRHLYMSDIICRKPLKIDALKHLETLTYISVDNWTCEFSGFNLMTSLKKLGIEDLDESSNIFGSLAELKNLRHLILKGFRFRCMPSLDELGLLRNLFKLKLEGRLTRLPSADNFPPWIMELRLINSCLDEDPMPILEKLPNLKYLKLQNAYTGRQMVISPFFMTHLHHLVIKDLWHLRNLQVGIGVMPLFFNLEIYSCPYLEITNLEEILSCSIYWKMVTTQNIAAKIRKSDLISRIDVVDITP